MVSDVHCHISLFVKVVCHLTHPTDISPTWNIQPHSLLLELQRRKHPHFTNSSGWRIFREVNIPRHKHWWLGRSWVMLKIIHLWTMGFCFPLLTSKRVSLWWSYFFCSVTFTLRMRLRGGKALLMSRKIPVLSQKETQWQEGSLVIP